MDFLRYPGGCYSRRVRLHPDDATLYTIRWFFTETNAKLFPGWHSFGSEVWRADHSEPLTGIGEAEMDRKWDRGRNHGYAGQCFRGKLEWFDTGMPVAELQNPPPKGCGCQVFFQGGLLLGGTFEGHIVVKGGLLLGGSFSATVEASSVHGGMKLGGKVSDGITQSLSGGLLLGGKFTATIQAPGISGGLLLGGSVAVVPESSSISGGLLLGGKVTPAVTAEKVAGGLLLGGKVTPAVTAEKVAGGLLLGGSLTATVSHGTVSPGTPNDPVAKVWTLVVSGYTGAAAGLNGTWVITYVSGTFWSSPTVGGFNWGMVNSGPSWRVGGGNGPISSGFTLTSGSFHGNAANTLSHDAGSSFGDTGFPATITITPS